MKKIGILTYYKGYNYGSVLQAFALVEFLRINNYKVFIIDYLNHHDKCSSFYRIVTYIRRIMIMIRHPIMGVNIIIKKITSKKNQYSIPQKTKELFHEFRIKNFKFSKLEDDKFDFFICGSDQIWNIKNPSLSEIFFLRFTKKQKRIAYAPSFGGIEVPKYNEKQLKKYLSEMGPLSIREESGVKLIEKLIDKKVTQVLDPVLLFDKKYWIEKTKKMNKNIYGDYILCYFLDEISESSVAFIKELSEKHNMKVLWIDLGISNDNFEKIYVSPFEFIALINNAKYICTDSYHGTAFSLILNKKFYLFKRNYKSNPEQETRLVSLLKIIDADKIGSSNQDFISYDDVDFDYINNCIDIKRDISREYLLRSLE